MCIPFAVCQNKIQWKLNCTDYRKGSCCHYQLSKYYKHLTKHRTACCSTKAQFYETDHTKSGPIKYTQRTSSFKTPLLNIYNCAQISPFYMHCYTQSTNQQAQGIIIYHPIKPYRNEWTFCKILQMCFSSTTKLILTGTEKEKSTGYHATMNKGFILC